MTATIQRRDDGPQTLFKELLDGQWFIQGDFLHIKVEGHPDEPNCVYFDHNGNPFYDQLGLEDPVRPTRVTVTET